MSTVRGTNVSVHTSSFADDYRLKCFRDLNNLPKYCATGTEIGMLANRVSWFYDFQYVVPRSCSFIESRASQELYNSQEIDSEIVI
jgi:hypothetical protein